MVNLSPFLFIILISLFISACSEPATKRPAPDVSSSYLEVLTAHPMMTDLYFKQLTRLYNENNDTFNVRLKGFLSDNRITTLADTVATIYSSTKDLENELGLALKYLKHYFPEQGIPNFYTLYTEFSYQPFIFNDQDKDAIGIGLDMFLGDDFNYKKIDPGNPVFSEYLTRTYNRDHLVKKAVEMIVVDLLGQTPGKRFLDKMIFQGKKQYILERLLPSENDTILWEYTPAQLAWVESEELAIWDFFREQKLIYETSHLKIANYLDPAPGSKGMPEAAPGRTANYIGYKMVTSFMKRNPDFSLRDLVNYEDSQMLMEKAKYKPPRK